ncbi:hypothetical protein GCM10023354_22310 [Garicola koreensis]
MNSTAAANLARESFTADSATHTGTLIARVSTSTTGCGSWCPPAEWASAAEPTESAAASTPRTVRAAALTGSENLMPEFYNV